MSRSYREPIIPNADGSKEWKREANRKIRRQMKDVLDGAFFKKLSEVWTSPMEHKGRWDVPKMRRK